MSTSHNQKRSSGTKSEAEKQKTKIQIDEYKERWAKFQAAKDSLDASAIAATTQILELNPDAYSAWNLRRRVLVALWSSTTNPMSQEDINAMAHQDLKFIEKLVRVHPKSYWLWLHRGWILDHMPSPDWSRELKLVQMMLDLDPRNFHGWDYRRQVLKKAGKAAVPEELEYSMGKINQNFSNYSAWHYRSKLIPRVFSNELDSQKREAVIEKDFEVVRNAIYTEPADQSAWLYQRWLLGQQEVPLGITSSRLEDDTLIICFNHPVAVDSAHLTVLGGRIVQPITEGRGSHVFAAKVSSTIKEIVFPRLAFRFYKGTWFSGESLKVSFKGSVEAVVSVEGGASLDVSVIKDQYQSRKVWEREMESIRELVEVEPDSKWPLMSLVHCMRELKGYSFEAIDLLNRLKKVDPDRVNYYSDYISDFKWESFLETLAPGVQSTTFPETFALTRIPTPYLLPPSLIHLTITNQKLLTIPEFPYVKKLILDDNQVSDWKGIQGCISLVELSVRRNHIKSVEGLKEVSPGSLKSVDVSENKDLRVKEQISDKFSILFSFE